MKIKNKINCLICGADCSPKLIKTIDEVAVTSDSKYTENLHPILSFCSDCDYWFTQQAKGLKYFYESEYELLMQDFKVDQRITIGGQLIGRAKYQSNIIANIQRAIKKGKVLEVGAGKGLTASLVSECIDLDAITLHDPGAERYSNIWKKYVPNCKAVTHLSEIGKSQYDFIYTFFTLEHTETPRADMDLQLSALEETGILMGVIPYLSMNPGDLLVGDHCSHFNIASLKKLLSNVAINCPDLKWRIYLNRPLRGLFYVISTDKINLDLVENELLKIGGFEIEGPTLELPNNKLFEQASQHWDVTANFISNDGNDYLWGAGFYSKIIMLRHSSRKFSGCIDSNPDFLETNFSDASLNQLPIFEPNEWLGKIAKRGDRIWLGVSFSAKSSILAIYGERLKNEGITIAF